MKLLIGASPSKIFHIKEFANKLRERKIENKVVIDYEICNGFPNRDIRKWFMSKSKFNDLINSYRPDLIMIDRQRHFGLESIKTKIPLLVHLRGDFWSEIKWAKETTYKQFPKNIVINKWENMGNRIFEESSCILPICRFLEERINERFPKKTTHVLYQGISSENWFYEKGMKLKHPCVGLIQSANIWGKSNEMLILKNVLGKFPKITFYWAGDGPYAKKINSELSKFENFKWLGNLQYPNKVRQFLSEIDIYALISGIDMSPLTLLEAQLMKKPVLATSVGGIPELMQDKKTGYLIEKGNESDIIDKISLMLNEESIEVGEQGRKFVSERFSWEKISDDFIKFIKEEYNFE